MEQIKVTAICTRAVEYREFDKLIELCSLQYGKLTVLARGVKKPSAKLKFASSPFNFGEYMLVERNGRYTMCDCSQIESFLEISEDLERFCVGSTMLEFLSKLLQNEKNPNLVLNTIFALKKMCFEGQSSFQTLNWLMIENLKILGYQMDFSHCASCLCQLEKGAIFEPSQGIVCKNCANEYGIAIPENALMCFQNPLDGENENSKIANILLKDMVYSLLGIKLKNMFDI